MGGHWKKADRRALAVAVQAAKRGRSGPATDDDRPPLSSFKGRRVRVLAGQLDLDGHEHK
jgi:hypothetical protein